MDVDLLATTDANVKSKANVSSTESLIKCNKWGRAGRLSRTIKCLAKILGTHVMQSLSIPSGQSGMEDAAQLDNQWI